MEKTRKYWLAIVAGVVGFFLLLRVIFTKRPQTPVEPEERVTGDTTAISARRAAIDAELRAIDAEPTRNTQDMDARALADEYVRLRSGR